MIEQIQVVSEAVSSGMIEKIQLTSILIVLVCWVPIQAIKSENMSMPSMIVILAGLCGGVVTALVTSLMRIWL